MNLPLNINGHALTPKERDGIRVVTFKDIDELHERPAGTARKRFNDNKKRFVERTDFFKVKCDEVRPFFGQTLPNGFNPNADIILLTESGYLMIVKSFNDDLAWKVQRQLVNAYFRAKEAAEAPILPQDYPTALRALADAEEQKLRLLAETAQQQQLIGELKPKADYTDRILKSTGVVPVTAIAKDYGMSGTQLNKLLHELGVQYRMGDMWLLYRQYQDKGYTHSQTFDFAHCDGRPDSKMTTKWTQKGRLFLYELLKSNGILPMIERT